MGEKTTANEIIKKYPDGVPVLVLAKFIGLQASGMRRKAIDMNGQVKYDRTIDTLSIEQLKVFLPSYLFGSRPLTGSKRTAVKALKKAINTPVQQGDITPAKQAYKTPINSPVKQGKMSDKSMPVNRPAKIDSKDVEKEQIWYEYLRIIGNLIAIILGSTPLLFIYFFVAISAEAYLQAELFETLIDTAFTPLFIGCLTVLFVLVLSALAGKKNDTVLYSKEVYSRINRQYKTRVLKASTIFEIIFLIYNVLLCEARFFQKATCDIWIDYVVLIFAGLIIPLIISYVGLLLRERITGIKMINNETTE